MGRRARRLRAMQLTARAAGFLPTDIEKAEVLYRKALDLDDTIREAWFDLGLVGKVTRRWDLAKEANERCIALGPRPEDPAFWNLGIAATALHEWDIAREAWAGYGLGPFDGHGELELDLGPTPVRLNPGGDGEVVWGLRIDPARVRIESIPYPQSGHHWGDIVLHDGAPNGSRELNGIERPVFDELDLWRPSGVPTTEIAVAADDPHDVEELLGSVHAAGIPCEDWSTNVQMICQACSTGRRHQGHSAAELSTGREHLIGAASPAPALQPIIDTWTAAPNRVVHWFEEAES